MVVVLFLVALLASLAVSVTASPLLEAQLLSPRDVARSAVEAYNQETGTQAVFRLFKLKSFHKTQFDWGTHFSINFTIKETNCWKSVAGYRLEDCRYRPNGITRDCSANISVLDFVQEAPLTSVKCTQEQRAKKTSKKPKPKAQSVPKVTVEYFPSSFSTAALTVPEEG
ncbi:cathelicidin-2-like [Dermochelys coriacea]|uniref:cathelicidin-2-like n=1 Tax=Dermochelys coriacea TaxID=27794 RepID=UPI0018E7FE2A|nr:cathelicidin-2-like [Dermochelys coriacea]